MSIRCDDSSINLAVCCFLPLWQTLQMLAVDVEAR